MVQLLLGRDFAVQTQWERTCQRPEVGSSQDGGNNLSGGGSGGATFEHENVFVGELQRANMMQVNLTGKAVREARSRPERLRAGPRAYFSPRNFQWESLRHR
jgi:hypothetical protein